MSLRLFKVASKFSVSTKDIVDHLESKGFDIENKPNSKVTGEMLEVLSGYQEGDDSIKEIVKFHRNTATGTEHKIIEEGESGVDFEYLFGDYIDEKIRYIEIVDPYIRLRYQKENLMHFLSFVQSRKHDGARLKIDLTTYNDDKDYTLNILEQISDNISSYGIDFSFELNESIHDRHIMVDDKWKITLGRGLDIYQKSDDWDLSKYNLKLRNCKDFTVTYIPKSSF